MFQQSRALNSGNGAGSSSLYSPSLEELKTLVLRNSSGRVPQRDEACTLADTVAAGTERVVSLAEGTTRSSGGGGTNKKTRPNAQQQQQQQEEANQADVLLHKAILGRHVAAALCDVLKVAVAANVVLHGSDANGVPTVPMRLFDAFRLHQQERLAAKQQQQQQQQQQVHHQRLSHASLVGASAAAEHFAAASGAAAAPAAEESTPLLPRNRTMSAMSAVSVATNWTTTTGSQAAGGDALPNQQQQQQLFATSFNSDANGSSRGGPQHAPAVPETPTTPVSPGPYDGPAILADIARSRPPGAGGAGLFPNVKAVGAAAAATSRGRAGANHRRRVSGGRVVPAGEGHRLSASNLNAGDSGEIGAIAGASTSTQQSLQPQSIHSGGLNMSQSLPLPSEQQIQAQSAPASTARSHPQLPLALRSKRSSSDAVVELLPLQEFDDDEDDEDDDDEAVPFDELMIMLRGGRGRHGSMPPAGSEEGRRQGSAGSDYHGSFRVPGLAVNHVSSIPASSAGSPQDRELLLAAAHQRAPGSFALGSAIVPVDGDADGYNTGAASSFGGATAGASASALGPSFRGNYHVRSNSGIRRAQHFETVWFTAPGSAGTVVEERLIAVIDAGHANEDLVDSVNEEISFIHSLASGACDIANVQAALVAQLDAVRDSFARADRLLSKAEKKWAKAVAKETL